MMPSVPSEGLLLGIAQIAVVMAGFTAVTSALTPPGGSWSPDQRIRLCVQLSVAVLSFYSVVAAASS